MRDNVLAIEAVLADGQALRFGRGGQRRRCDPAPAYADRRRRIWSERCWRSGSTRGGRDRLRRFPEALAPGRRLQHRQRWFRQRAEPGTTGAPAGRFRGHPRPSPPRIELILSAGAGAPRRSGSATSRPSTRPWTRPSTSSPSTRPSVELVDRTMIELSRDMSPCLPPHHRAPSSGAARSPPAGRVRRRRPGRAPDPPQTPRRAHGRASASRRPGRSSRPPTPPSRRPSGRCARPA